MGLIFDVGTAFFAVVLTVPVVDAVPVVFAVLVVVYADLAEDAVPVVFADPAEGAVPVDVAVPVEGADLVGTADPEDIAVPDNTVPGGTAHRDIHFAGTDHLDSNSGCTALVDICSVGTDSEDVCVLPAEL